MFWGTKEENVFHWKLGKKRYKTSSSIHRVGPSWFSLLLALVSQDIANEIYRWLKDVVA
jgi:hypothetical protein